LLDGVSCVPLKNFRIEAFYLFIADFFATQVIGGAKELVVLL